MFHSCVRIRCVRVCSKVHKVQQRNVRDDTKKTSRRVLYAKQTISMESFSYQTRLGWLPPLSLPPCSWRCTCNLLHPLWWHVLLTILNHPHWGCTYRRLQGQRRYCSKGEKRGKEKCPRHMYLLAQLEEPTNNFLNSLTKNCWGFIYWSKQLADNKASQTKKRCPVLSASKNTSNIQILFAFGLLQPCF